MDGAPYAFVTLWELVTEAGAHFDDQNSHPRARDQPRIDPRPQAPLHPYNVKQPSPPRTTYGPLANQHRVPPNNHRRPAFKPSSNPTAPSFPLRSTPPQPSPPSPITRANVQQNAGLRPFQPPRAPPAPPAPRIEVSPADPVAVVERFVAATTPAGREQSRSRGGSGFSRPTAGVQRRRSSSAARRPAPYTLSTASPTAIQCSFPPPAMNNTNSVRAWLPSLYVPPVAGHAQTTPTTLQPQAPRKPPAARSTMGTTASTRGQYFCTDPDCPTRTVSWPTRSERDKHTRNHLPMSARPFRCRASGCSKRFWWPKDLRRHERKHTGEKVQCTFCCDWLSRQDNLARHVEGVHSDLVTPPTPSVMTASSPSMMTASSPTLSFADSVARSDFYSPTIPSSPPSLGGLSFPPSGPRTGMPRHSSVNSVQGSPLQHRYNADYSEAMQKW